MPSGRGALLGSVLVVCWAVELCPSPAFAQCEQLFIRGDANANGELDLSDPLITLNFLYSGGDAVKCEDAADTDDNGVLELSDPVHTLQYLFVGDKTLPPPGETCGADLTADGIGCADFPPCGLEPREEVCDGYDNDCDGLVDEDTDLQTDPRHCGSCEGDCYLLDAPNVVAYGCEDGVCRVSRCAPGFYDADGIVENGCETELPPNFIPCDDGNPCTENDQFIGGLCGGTPKDCSHLDNDCNEGVCDPHTGDCVRKPLPFGSPCDDGDPRSTNDHCGRLGDCVGNVIP